MKPVQIIIDSTAYISREYAEDNNIEVVPLSVELCGQVRKEGYPGDFEDFFNKLAKSKDFPKTSQPSAGDFVEAYKRAFQRGDEIVVILFSSKLSGTYNSACIAAEILAIDNITVIDTESAVGNLKFLIEKAVELSKNGASSQEIVDIVNNDRKKTSINLTVETLEYLKRGGRLSNSKALIGTILNIKPIIGLVDGQLIPVDKVRGKKKAIETMIDMVPNYVKRISVGHVQNYNEANKVKELLEKRFEHAVVTVDEIGPVIGSHIGPNAIGICSSW